MYIAQSMSWHKVSAYSDNELEIVDDEREGATVVNEAENGSDSTIEDNSSIDHAAGDNIDPLSPNESLAYLQGLHSGNLMQFSQQSALQELMLQDMKPHIDTLPTLENHNNGGYEFGMVLKEPPRSHWMFSVPLNKLYIRMNKTFNIDVEFKAKLPIQPLNLRAFLCFVKEVSGPVLRCQNHLSTDSAKGNPKFHESLLRCANPATMYCGTSSGKSIVERYSVLVPLNQRPSQGGHVRQTLAFEFTCQNSCFGRKETCLVFCLENASGDILGQQILHVKICTCPKRDRNQDERNLQSQKRKMPSAAMSEDEEVEVSGTKSRRQNTSHLKEEIDSNDSSEMDLTMPPNWDLSSTSEGGYRLVIDFPKKGLLLQSIEGMIEKTATEILLSTQKNESQFLHQHVNNLLDLKKYAMKLP
ncbi:cellular tumor antigen p53 [Scaptodrosophila lebanonensis]|uniref:Cellular tumor antigen p53 n=1 Tax=Drosophila lebanonensis TaxID=7225 RepID=A0A6J2T3C1_DROLE|nr:cellular tumor antigen p53 [Scaptodrosophila lebanonensis]